MSTGLAHYAAALKRVPNINPAFDRSAAPAHVEHAVHRRGDC